jgi:predicted TIM-barrel fold metal-dependent hydrolase
MDIIDAHTHWRMPGEDLPPDSLRPWRTFEERLAVLREAGIGQAVACRNVRVGDLPADELWEWNRGTVQMCGASDDLLIPAAMVHPAPGYDVRELLRRCREELGMRFIGELFDRWQGFEWGTAEYYRLIECAIELRMVPMIHCENEVAAEIGERYPEGRFLLPHLDFQGDPERRLAALAPYPYLHADLSGTGMFMAGAVKAAVDRLGAERVLFATDFAGFDPVIAVQCVQRAGLDADQRERVFAGNFRALLAWTEE